MRAWQKSTEGLQIVERPTPEPGPGQALVRVLATGIGFPDVLMCRGTYPLTPTGAFTPGQEVVGTLPDGTRVMGVTDFISGRGGFAEWTVAPSEGLFPVPDGLPDAKAAGFWIPYMTAWIGLVGRGRLAAGETLAVLGAAGGSGAAAVQLGAALGAEVVAVVSTEEKAAFCRSIGAARTTLTTEEAPAADVVYDPVGGEIATAAAHRLNRDGRLLAVGFASGTWAKPDTHRLVTSNASLVGVFAGGHSRAELDAMHASLSALVADGKIAREAVREYPFEDLPRALQALDDRSGIGKSVLLAPA